MLDLREEPLQATTFAHWTDTGLDCKESGADCENCTIFKTIGLHKSSTEPERRCHQPRVNDFLTRNKIDAQSRHVQEKLAKPYMHRPVFERLMPEQVAEVRAEIVRVIAGLEVPTISQIADVMTKAQYMDRWWDSRAIHHHVLALKRQGILELDGYSLLRAKEGIYRLTNAGVKGENSNVATN